MRHNYLSNLDIFSNSEQYKLEVKRRAKVLIKRQIPVILSLNHLAILSKSSFQELQGYVFTNRKDFGYHIFPIRKRCGGKRWICVPEPFLKSSQKFINENILYSSFALGKLSESCTAYVPKKGQVENALLHHGSRDILKIDVSNFFESISERQVYKVFQSFGYPTYTSFILTRICTRAIDKDKDFRFENKKRWSTKNKYKLNFANISKDTGSSLVNHEGWSFITEQRSSEDTVLQVGHLPQGASTSPMLANLVCIDLDEKIENIALEYELSYTRYADDIVLSGEISNPQLLISKIYRLLSNKGFSPNKNKTQFVRQGQRQIITGLSIGDKKCLRVPKSYKQKIRQELYYIEKFGLSGHCRKIDYEDPITYALRLEGKINYVKKIEPQIGRRFLDKLKEIVPNLQLYNSL